MNAILEIWNTHPSNTASNDRTVLEALLCCVTCASVCRLCADACLSEQEPLIPCARVNLDCADLCDATAGVLSRNTTAKGGVTAALLRSCAKTCRGCAEECQRHAERMKHCSICAQTCLACAMACEALLTEV